MLPAGRLLFALALAATPLRGTAQVERPALDVPAAGATHAFHLAPSAPLALELRADGACELVAWAAAETPGLRLRLARGDGRDPVERRATDADPVPLVVLDAPTGRARAVLECATATNARFAWHALPLAPERRAELERLRARLAALATGDTTSGAASVGDACAALLDELLGPDGELETWLGSQIAREIGERAGHAERHELVALAMGRAGDFREALVPLRSSQVLELRLMEARALARTQDLAAARAKLERLLPIVDELFGRGSTVSLGARQDLAACLRMQGELERARDLYVESIDAANETLAPGHFEHIRLLHNAAALCFELADSWRSLQLDQEALALLREQPSPIPEFEHAIRLQLALTARSLGTRVPAFEDEHRRALAELETTLGARHPDVLRLKSNLAGALADAGRREAALPLAREVLAARLATLGAAHTDTLFSELRLAQVLSGLGEREEALGLQLAVLELCERTRPSGDPFLRRAHGTVVRTLRALGRAEEAERRTEEWIDALADEVRSSLLGSWRERRERIASLRSDLHSLASYGPPRFDSLLSDDATPIALFELIETARAASAAGPLRIGADERDADLRALFEKHAESRRTLGQRASSGAYDADRLMEARNALDARERALARKLDERGLLPFRAVDARASSRAAGPSAALLGFTAFDTGLERPLGSRPGTEDLFFHVSLLTSDGRLRSRFVRSLCALETAVARWRAAVRVPVDERPEPAAEERVAAERAAGREVLELVFGTWLDELGPEVDSLFVCVEGALILVPLDALAWGDDGVLGDRLRVRYLTSFDELTAVVPAPASAPRLFAAGGLEYGDASVADTAAVTRFAPLPGSAEEVLGVAALFERAGSRANVLLAGEAATREAVRAGLGAATHALLATHGWFDASSLEGLDVPSDVDALDDEMNEQQVVATMAPLSLCRLALSGANLQVRGDGEHPGIWTGEEIAGEDLRRLELVVLSACDTNRSLRRGGLGVLSLPSALHAAGAQRSLTSLWRVKTDYGRLLVERFFAEVLAGASASDALWDAKRYLRDERGLPTRFWAGWILSGDR